FPAEEIHAIQSATSDSKNPVAMARSALAIWLGVRTTSGVIVLNKAVAMVVFSGYRILTPVLADPRHRVPALVHEQNAVMGRANKAFATRVTAIAGGFLPEEGPFAQKIIMAGNPVRPAVLRAAEIPYQPANRGKPFHLLVFGG